MPAPARPGMADPTFFHKSGSYSLAALAELTGAALSAPADGARIMHDVAPLDAATSEQLSFLDNSKYVEAFAASRAGACFVRPKFAGRAPATMALLLSEDPYSCYATAAQAFYPQAKFTQNISEHAHIAANARIGVGVRIEAGVIIGERVTIGKNCCIGAHTVIEDGVQIGDDCRIGAHCTISHAILGERTVLHRGIHIGQDGFGFAASSTGAIKVPQLGRVLIGDDVEIGSGTCIDRGSGPDTVIGAGSKIDNLVQIGHNTRIGRAVMIAAQVGIAGSTTIEDGVMLGGQVGIAGHVRIHARAKVSAQSGIMTDIPAGATYGGFPAQPIRDWHRQTATLAKLTKHKEPAYD